MDEVVRYMAADVAGMICDGAGSGCATKVSTSTASAWRAVLAATSGTRVPAHEGIVGRDADETARHLGRLVHDGIDVTDRTVLQIMVAKRP